MHILWCDDRVIHAGVIIYHVQQHSRMKVDKIRELVTFDLIVFIYYALVDVQ